MNKSFEEYLEEAADLVEQNQGSKALALLKQMEKKWPLEPIIYYDMGMIFYLDKKYKKAEKNFRHAAEMGGRDAELFNQWGLCLDRLKRSKEAEIAYLDAIEIDPEFWKAWNNLGVISFMAKEYVSARKYFSKALELNPYNADTWYNLRDTCRELGDEEEARHADERYQELK